VELDWAVMSKEEAESDVEELVFASLASILDVTKVTDPRSKWRLDVGAEFGLCKAGKDGGSLRLLGMCMGFDADKLEEVMRRDLDVLVQKGGWAHQTARMGLGGACMTYSVGTERTLKELIHAGASKLVASFLQLIGHTTTTSKMYNGTISHTFGPWAFLPGGKDPVVFVTEKLQSLRERVAGLARSRRQPAAVEGCKEISDALGKAYLEYLSRMPPCAPHNPKSIT
jgi:hypothetical protein